MHRASSSYQIALVIVHAVGVVHGEVGLERVVRLDAAHRAGGRFLAFDGSHCGFEARLECKKCQSSWGRVLDENKLFVDELEVVE